MCDARTSDRRGDKKGCHGRLDLSTSADDTAGEMIISHKIIKEIVLKLPNNKRGGGGGKWFSCRMTMNCRISRRVRYNHGIGDIIAIDINKVVVLVNLTNKCIYTLCENLQIAVFAAFVSRRAMRLLIFKADTS